MNLRPTTTGHECPSDPGITFNSRRNGWRVRVDREGHRPLHHTAKTLAEASAWARQHWEPEFLRGVRAALPVSLAHLHRQAIDGGDPVTYYALLDAAEEAGAEVSRGHLTYMARAEGLLPADLPWTEDERRHVVSAARIAAMRARTRSRG